MAYTTVLKSENQGDGCTQREGRTQEVHLQKLLLERGIDPRSVGRGFEGQQDDSGGQTANRKINVEAPEIIVSD